MAISGNDGSIILTTNVDQSGLKKGFGSMKKLASTAGKAFLAIGAAAATATVAITKMAVSAYADYEQLVGGVETLFKGSAKKVIDYANDAFYTAGVSANEYMKQVTSFSASLIRSTAGDTDKAADIANMALIDISDNVNKMGSSMESVTLAYQGFAKQQYMLLDNLKLGYGGTKTEMERLLKDAQALTGVKYDINNLADVYSAIHAIQKELGITGTTAKEAEKTITGSANMMKAAWKNVLSAIAGGGDLDRAINNLVYSVQRYFENIVPVVERSLVGIGKLIEQIAPMLVQNVASALIQSIPSLVNAIYQMIVGLAKGIWQGIKALFTGGSGSVTADIKTSLSGVATEAGNASAGMEELGDATEEAGKQAKKALAAFDELQILSSGSDDISVEFPEASAGGNVPTAETTMDILTESTGEQATWLMQMLGELAEAFSGLQDIDLTNLANSLALLKNSLQGLVGVAWNIILWAIEKIIVPLTRFVVNNVLPRFFTTLSIVIDGFRVILENAWDILKQFIDEFLTPIWEYTEPKILEFWDNFNTKLKEFIDLVEKSEVWEDLKTILSAIYEALVPTIQGIIDFITPIMNFQMSQAFIDLEYKFKNLEDIIGAIADIINGDFDAAWQHLKELFIDNFVDEGKEKFQAFSDVIEAITGFDLAKWVKDTWKSVKEFWTEDIQPIFTKEWWESLGKTCINGLIDGFEGGINGILTGFESMINWVVDGLNKISFDIPDWLGGGTFGINLPRANFGRISIPRLAQGAVIPPNREFLAVLGDQKQGTNIEAPADLIKQKVMEAMVEMGGIGQTTKEEHYYLDKTELMNIVYKLFKGGERINGTSLIKG